MTRLLGPAPLALVAAAAMCAGPPPSGESFLSLAEWAVSPEPAMTLGDETQAATTFQGALPARLPNGDLLVADVESRELRLFRGGELRSRLSRQGRGPGELTGMFSLTLSWDTIFTIGGFDSQFEINRFSPDSGFRSGFRLQFPAGARGFAPVGRLSSGAFVAQQRMGGRPATSAPALGRLEPDSVTVALFQPGGDDSTGTLVEIGRFRRWSLVAHEWPGGPMPTAQTRASLAPMTAWTASGSLLWVADAETGAIRAFDGRGELAASGSLPLTRQPIDPAAVARARDAALGRARNDFERAIARAVHDPALLPATMPLFDFLVAGHDGELWVRLFEVVPGRTREYIVVSRRGVAAARVTLPAELTVHQVGFDYVLGVRRDADGVARVAEFRLERR